MNVADAALSPVALPTTPLLERKKQKTLGIAGYQSV